MGKQQIIDALKKDIIRGKFTPGERLVESQLCQIFDTGRGRIREALKALESDGFVEITPHVGASVMEFSQRDIEQISDLIGVVEGLAVRVATPQLSDERIEALAQIVNQMETTKDKAEFFQLNR